MERDLSRVLTRIGQRGNVPSSSVDTMTPLRSAVAPVPRVSERTTLLAADPAAPTEQPWFVTAAVTPVLAGLAASRPSAPALTEDGDRVLRRADLWRHACGVAHMMAQLAEPGRPLGLALPSGIPTQVAILGCLMAGRPALLLDPRDTPARLAGIAAEAGAAAFLAAPGATLPEGFLRFDLGALPDAESPPAEAIGPDDPAIIIPTSGSTGRPKGIAHSRRTVLFRAAQLLEEWNFGPGERFLSLGPGNTIGSMVNCLAAIMGGALLLKPDAGQLGLAGVMAAAQRCGGVTGIQAVPSLLRTLLAMPEAAAALGALRACQASGEPLLAADVEALQLLLPAGCELVNIYGLTEAPALLRWVAPPDFRADGPRVPAGRPLPGVRLALLDPHGQPAPSGEPGELVATGRFVALGDWRGGGIVRGERIGPAPDSPDERQLRTGDLAQLRPDGHYDILGRMDRQVKIAGRRLDLAEVEDALCRAPGVAAAAVLADTGPDGATRVMAAVVPGPTAPEAFLPVVRRHLRVVLPGWMQPARLIRLSHLPTLPGGKLDAAAVRAMAAAETTAETAQAVVPTDPLLARAWRRILGASPMPGVAFDAAGGDSLGFLRFILELERILRREVGLDALHPGMTADEMSTALGNAPALAAADAPLVLLLPGIVGDREPLARLRDGCPALRFAVARYPAWKALARGGSRLEQDAEAIADQAMALSPAGTAPILAGYSYGGYVAHAAAASLARRGRPVRHLLLLDPDLGFGSDAAAAATGGDNGLSRQPHARLRWRFRWIGQSPRRIRLAAAILPAVPPRGALALQLWTDLVYAQRNAAVQRWARERLPRLDVPATLFRSEEPRPAATPDLGWARHVDLRAIIAVPGTHETMMLPPHRAALCRAFEKAVLGGCA